MSTPKHLSRRDFLRISSFSVAGIALAACAAPGAPSSSAPAAGGEASAPSGEKITIRYHARIGQQEDTLYDMQEPKFMEENPNIELVRESFPGEEYEAKMATMYAGGTQGDVIWSALGGAKIQFAYSQGQVASISDLVASENVDLSQWYEGCLNGITVEGNLLGLPFKAHPGLAVVYYNKTAIEAEGLPIPENDWTQEEHIELAKALTKTEGDRVTQFGFLPGVGSWWKVFVTLTRAFGGELLNEDGTQFALLEDAGRQAMQYIYDVFHTHKVGPLPEQIVGTTNEMWISGVLATYQGGTSVAVTESAIGDSFEWMVAPNPIGPGGVGGSDYEVDAQCVTTSSEHPVEAFKWVQYLCNRDSGVQLGLIGGTVGGRPDVYGAEELLQFPYRVVFKEIMDNAQASRITANWRQTEAETAFNQLMQPIWAGTEQPNDAYLETVRAQIQDIMDKPKP
jgi:multiple sugar transport system substrate-binding protein